MSWKLLSLHFKQQYDGAYRYLDNCGEFMLDAVSKLNFIPGETKPSGAVLEIPEKGIKAAVDTFELTVSQELPDEKDLDFLQHCLSLVDLVNHHFSPNKVIRNGFAIKLFWSIPDAGNCLATSLQFGDQFHLDLAKTLGMVPDHKKIDLNFSSGSMDLHVLLHPVTFEKLSVNRHNPNYKSSSTQHERTSRRNKFADRFDINLSHAMLLELDLMEVDPPKSALKEQFDEVWNYSLILKEVFFLK